MNVVQFITRLKEPQDVDFVLSTACSLPFTRAPETRRQPGSSLQCFSRAAIIQRGL
jgi:hypothetical protein